MGFSESSVLLKIALVVLPLALILHIAGLATPNWSSASASANGQSVSSTAGLWKACLEGGGEKLCESYETVLDWIKACQAFGIIGVLAVAAAAILEVLCTVVFSKDTHKVAYILAAMTAFSGAGCIIVTAIIWAAKASEISSLLDLSWSFGLSIAGGVLAGIGGVLGAIDLCQTSLQSGM
ncbi:uncharacterized protein LOC132547035 [Ylistrum balloti]|uniref:uncharacterized protein LOC132547035 n=1 Tax=Ylistrum balloti TaxID=509963 RepID=UPI002905D38B|nr:uncharacterized protein LOC132547035 [Ylistrum balloti]